MAEVSVARAETETRAETLREAYLAAVAERCVELGSPLTEEERDEFAARAEAMYPDGEGS
jgi:hypothetical protein